jgi:hypothetical protein
MIMILLGGTCVATGSPLYAGRVDSRITLNQSAEASATTSSLFWSLALSLASTQPRVLAFPIFLLAWRRDRKI